MSQIMRKEPLTIFGDGMQTRAFSYIDDVAPHIARSVTLPAARGQVINIGADAPFSVNELAEVVGRALDVKPKLVHLPARNEVQHAYCDHARAREIFGACEPVSLEQGIQRMAGWASRVGTRQSRAFDAIEIRKNMPSIWSK
jgi:UDP-glucose 4-epimerase